MLDKQGLAEAMLKNFFQGVGLSNARILVPTVFSSYHVGAQFRLERLRTSRYYR